MGVGVGVKYLYPHPHPHKAEWREHERIERKMIDELYANRNISMCMRKRERSRRENREKKMIIENTTAHDDECMTSEPVTLCILIQSFFFR